MDHFLVGDPGRGELFAGQKCAAIVPVQDVEAHHAGLVGRAQIEPTNLVTRVDEVLYTHLEVLLGLNQGVLCVRKELHSAAGPVSVIGAHIKDAPGQEPEALQGVEQDGSSKITLRPIVDTGETQAKGPEQGLNKSFQVCNLNRILDQG